MMRDMKEKKMCVLCDTALKQHLIRCSSKSELQLNSKLLDAHKDLMAKNWTQLSNVYFWSVTPLKWVQKKQYG